MGVDLEELVKEEGREWLVMVVMVVVMVVGSGR